MPDEDDRALFMHYILEATTQTAAAVVGGIQCPLCRAYWAIHSANTLLVIVGRAIVMPQELDDHTRRKPDDETELCNMEPAGRA